MERVPLSQNPVLRAQFLQYVQICNDALLLNCSRYPYKQIWDAAGVFTRRLKICAALIHRDLTYEAVMILKDSELGMMPETCCGCAKCYGEERHWTINADEILDAVHHPGLYTSQPGRLNWEWLLPDKDYLSAQGKLELQAEQA